MFSLGGSRDVEDLIARGKYAKAAKLLEQEIANGSRDPRARLRLADVLVLEGRGIEAIPLLFDLSDEYASDGQVAKAIALIKKIQKLSPGRRDAEQRLAALVKAGRREKPAADAVGYAPSGTTFGADHFQGAVTVAPPADTHIERLKSSTWVPSTHQEPDEEIALPPVPPPSSSPPPGPPDDETMEVFEVTPQPPAPVPDTPLFNGFSQDELAEVIRGFRLRSFEAGDVVLLEGERGDSLFVVTTGMVKAFVRSPHGGEPLLVRRMAEGDFFGEISILSGKPRTATVTAATPCEMLELDRATLDGITATYPHVRQVLEEFYISRASTQEEAMRRSLEAKGNS
jgi:hypothetical protein